MSRADAIAAATPRFTARREAIVAAAATLINQHGVRGMTFPEVARLVAMNHNSIAYYFKRKELLAAAALSDTLARMAAMIDDAGEAADPRARVARYLRQVFASQRRLRRGEERPMATLSDIRSLDEEQRAPLIQRYRTLFRKTRDLFGRSAGGEGKLRNSARAHILLESVMWLPAWLRLYADDDFDRVRARLFELLDGGIAARGLAFDASPMDIGLDRAPAEPGGEAYLRAATRLINRHGYRGASVEAIAAELRVTKGSFYHHLRTKEALVLECFRRSYDTVSAAQKAAIDADGDHWRRLSLAVATLLDVQFSDKGPLLRTTALAALPLEHRAGIIAQSDRLALRFAGMMIDGISEGAIRAVDPLIASQVLMAMLNAAFDLRPWVEQLGRERGVALYAATLAQGLFDPAPDRTA